MRFLSTLILSICCLAISLQSSAGNIPVKQLQASNAYYNTAEAALPNDALNDYCQLTSLLQHNHASSLQKENVFHPCGGNNNNTAAYILNDDFQHTRLFFSGHHAKIFRSKLIFPQHYYW